MPDDRWFQKALANGTLPQHVLSCVNNAERIINLAPGQIEVHFKFTCAKCGARLSFEEPNTLYETGDCDVCHFTTDVKSTQANLNFMVIATGKEATERLAQHMGWLGQAPNMERNES